MTATVPDAAVAALPDDVRRVLHAAAVVIAERSSQEIDPDRVVNEPQGVAELLTLLERSRGLRVAVAAATADDRDEPITGLAARLVSHDDATAEGAVTAVRALLDEHRRATRRATREAQRARRTPAAQRKEERSARRLEETRKARDRARARAELAEAEAAALRVELAELKDELAGVIGRAEAAELRLAAARKDAADPFQAAAALAAALTPTLINSEPESRGVGPGEPARVDPGRPSSVHPVPTAAIERAVAAARAAGLPAGVATAAGEWLPALLNAFVNPPQPLHSVRERGLRIEVLGGGTEIGGSCVLVTAGATRLLIDAGTRPGATTADKLAPPRIERAFDGPLHGIVITHAHNDHAGWVPAVLTRRPDTPVLVTEPTAALLAPMWYDSAKVLARRNGRADGNGVGTPYGHDDVRHALSLIHVVPFGRRRRVGDVDVELFQAGHIVGAAGVVVHVGDQRIVVSGDVSRPGQRSVGGIKVPESARGADLLLLESTYAASGQVAPRAAEAAQLVSDIATVTSAGGRVLIPAFALGRAQEVALTLAAEMPDVNVLIDGLARDVTTVYERQQGPDGSPLQIFGDRVRAVPPGGTRDAIANFRSGVVIATSGMLTAGPAVAWAKALMPDPNAGLMVVGYQDEESPGARLLALERAGGGEFALPAGDGQTLRVPVNAQVSSYGLGAHATADELISITADISAKRVMLVHGEPRGQAVFATRLTRRGQATVPTGDWSPDR